MSETLWVLGAGELGGRVARRWQEAGGSVVAITQTTARHQAYLDDGIQVQLGLPLEMNSRDKLLICVPGYARLKEVIGQLKVMEPPCRTVLTSSTGYYGTDGGNLGPDSPHGTTERALSIHEMEDAFRGWAGERGVIMRLGGLYRQGRGPLNAYRTRGVAPRGPADRILPLLHYDDAAQVVTSALAVPEPDKTYLAVTLPAPKRQEFYLAASVILELPLPAFSPSYGVAPAEYDISRTVDSLGYQPKYPRWQAALVP